MSRFDEMKGWGQYDVIREEEVLRRVRLAAEYRKLHPAALPAKRKPVVASRSPKAVASSTKRGHGKKRAVCKR